MILVLLIAIGIGVSYLKYYLEEKREEKVVQYENDIQYVTNSLRLLKLLDDNDIDYDIGYKNKLTSYSEEILKNSKYIYTSIEHVGNLYTLSLLTNNKKTDKIIDKMNSYYIEDYGLFNDYEVTSNNIKKINIDKKIASNCSLLQECLDDSIDERFHISEGLAKWFNDKATSDYTDEDKENMDWIIRCLRQRNKLDLIDITPIKDDIEKEYISEEKELEKTKNEDKDMYFYALQSLMIKSEVLGIKNDYQERLNETWKELSSWEEIDFDFNDNLAPLWLILSLEDVTDVSANVFFRENIKSELKNSYRTVIEDGK